MRRLVILFILFLLPLQWTYAAVADYCQHEESRLAQKHVGHHAHNHVDQGHDSKGKTGGFGDQDCPTCHHAPAAIVISPIEPLLPSTPVQIAFRSHRIPDRSPDNPFRPPHFARA